MSSAVNASIVGLDPSLTSTGLAIHFPGRSPSTARIRSSGKADATWDQRAARLRKLTDDITFRIPIGSLVVMEAPSYSSVGGAQHDRSGLWWSLYQALIAKGCAIVPVTPAQRMKYAVGKGGGKGCDKDNILAAAIRRYPTIDITGNDIADAVLFMAIGCRLSGDPIDRDLPQAHVDALNKLALPERTEP